jgi:3-methyladenine DNA glycosylase/8-oxoguanine DNA glycosylase
LRSAEVVDRGGLHDRDRAHADRERELARRRRRDARAQRGVADGELDLEALDGSSDLPDDEVAQRLLALPGVGPYAAAHVMMLLGRYGRLILDSWTRPTYARLAKRKTVKDTTIERRFRRYKDFAGLAFWLYLTRDWVPDQATSSGIA